MIPSSLLPIGWTAFLKKILPFVLIVLGSIAVVAFVAYQWESTNEQSYKKGVEKGRDELQAEFDHKAIELQQDYNRKLDEVKQKGLKDAKQAEDDAAAARDVTFGVQRQLDQLRYTVRNAGASFGISGAAGETVLLLADMLEQSIQRGDGYASFADRAFNAAQQCKREYEAVRETYGKEINH